MPFQRVCRSTSDARRALICAACTCHYFCLRKRCWAHKLAYRTSFQAVRSTQVATHMYCCAWLIKRAKKNSGNCACILVLGNP
ncbi:hypothetical protein GQ54DRAFT_98791 [Martensiomyces pterosporus]|nr:hypothetical protein GQ54DRAFT_98791 [Martensiomyces pterosporus]